MSLSSHVIVNRDSHLCHKTCRRLLLGISVHVATAIHEIRHANYWLFWHCIINLNVLLMRIWNPFNYIVNNISNRLSPSINDHGPIKVNRAFHCCGRRRKLLLYSAPALLQVLSQHLRG